MKEMTVNAAIESIEDITAFIDEELEQLDCPPKAQMQIDVAIDELFSNIAYYAYNPEIGQATVQLDVLENPLAVVITFIDHGKPFNPLEKTDPDIAKTADEREVGGLGIFIVKKTMDCVDYRFEDGKNILSIKKTLE